MMTSIRFKTNGKGVRVTGWGKPATECNFKSILAKFGAIHSNSRKRNPYDNTVMESFYITIKRKFILDFKYAIPEQVQKNI